MTIYCKDPHIIPSWDKSGEKRMGMSKEEAKKYKGAVTIHTIAQAKDGRWSFGTKGEEELRARKKGDFSTAPEAVAAADAAGAYIILNTAPPMAQQKKKWADVAPKKAAAIAELNEKIEEHNAAVRVKRGGLGRRVEPQVKEKKAAAPGAKPRGKGIGSFCEGLILDGKTDAQVLAGARAQFPDAATKEASIKWYRNKLIKEGKLK